MRQVKAASGGGAEGREGDFRVKSIFLVLRGSRQPVWIVLGWWTGNILGYPRQFHLCKARFSSDSVILCVQGWFVDSPVYIAFLFLVHPLSIKASNRLLMLLALHCIIFIPCS